MGTIPSFHPYDKACIFIIKAVPMLINLRYVRLVRLVVKTIQTTRNLHCHKMDATIEKHNHARHVVPSAPRAI